jgi:hypothetical protein
MRRIHNSPYKIFTRKKLLSDQHDKVFHYIKRNNRLHNLKRNKQEVYDTSKGVESGVGGALDEGAAEDGVGTDRFISTSFSKYFFASTKNFFF